MAKIYTKVGDKGQTSLLGGSKVAKDDVRIEAYGTVDELNSVLGLARAELERVCREKAKSGEDATALAKLNGDLEVLQHRLFDLGSLLASVEKDRIKFNLPQISTDDITWLEERIDGATAVLKPLKNFILPGGSECAARLHVARTVARRAERCMIVLGADLPENAIPFMNRTSDYLFTMARYANYLLGVSDVQWAQKKI